MWNYFTNPSNFFSESLFSDNNILKSDKVTYHFILQEKKSKSRPRDNKNINSKLHMYVSQSYWGRNEAGRSDIATMKKGMTQCPTEGEQKCLNTFHLRELHPGSKVEQIRFLAVSFCWWTIFIFIFASSFQWKCRTLAWLNNWAKNLITSPFFLFSLSSLCSFKLWFVSGS